MKNTKVDYLVIGAGLGGLVTAKAIEIAHPNLQGMIVESSAQVGGNSKAQMTSVGTRNQGFRQFPATDLSRKAFAFIEKILNRNIVESERKSEPVSFQDGSLKPFVGFGDASVPFYNELSYFLKPNLVDFSIPLHCWPDLIVQSLTSEIKLKSEVTRIESNQNSFSVTINGQHNIEAKKLISTLPMKSLVRLLENDLVPVKLGQKITKLSGWTAVHFDIVTKNTTTDCNELHILFGSSSESTAPVWGAFEKAADDGMQLSQWMTLVAEPESEDPEVLGQALKTIRKQLKRAYPEIFSAVEKEKIIIHSGFGHESDLKLSSAYAWPKNENLLIANGRINSEQNIVGLLLQAELVAAAFQKLESSAEDVPTIEVSL